MLGCVEQIALWVYLLHYGSAFKMAEEIVAEEGQQMGMKWNVIENSVSLMSFQYYIEHFIYGGLPFSKADF